jgi:REP element-mobilizing transposase RayT
LRSIIGFMPQSLSKVTIHIIFSTKNREPLLDLTIRLRMHAYLPTICRDLGGEALRVSGVADHVHVVTTLPRTLSQAQPPAPRLRRARDDRRDKKTMLPCGKAPVGLGSAAQTRR